MSKVKETALCEICEKNMATGSKTYYGPLQFICEECAEKEFDRSCENPEWVQPFQHPPKSELIK